MDIYWSYITMYFYIYQWINEKKKEKYDFILNKV